MKIQQQLNVNEVIGAQKQHKFKITDGSQAIIMDSLINLYSDPIGSIVREITSNCIDANRERDLKLAGKIPMDPEDNKAFWSTKQTVCIEYLDKNTILNIERCIIFHDYGCGLSQRRVQDVFTTFGASTKRDNNYEIGGFGLGAKSPLAYADTFYVSSKFNGTETYYMIYRNNDNVPHMDQVYKTSTDQQNGTTIIVPIKTTEDAVNFGKAISDQLAYFDNVIFKNIEYLGKILNYYNKHSSAKVLEETDSYVITSDGSFPCLLVGRVRYPINWDLIKLREYDYKASVAFKFDIGVLDLVPSREEVRYTANTINLITKALNDVKDQFKKDVSVKYASCTDYVDYLISISHISSRYSSYNSIASDDPFAVKTNMVKLSAYDVDFSPNKNLSPKNTTRGSAFYKLFAGISIYYCRLSTNPSAIGGKTILNTQIHAWDVFLNRLNSCDKMYHVKGNFSKLKSFTILNDKDSFIAFKADKDKIGERVEKQNFVDDRSDFVKLAAFNTISKLLTNSKFVTSYDNVEEADLEESTGVIVDNKTLRKINKMVFARDAYIKATGYETEIKHTNKEYKISTLQEKLQAEDSILKTVVYAETKDILELNKVVIILSSSQDYISSPYATYEYYFNKGAYRVLKVSKSVAKEFKDLEGFITAHEFMKNPKHLQRFITAQKIDKYIKSFSFLSKFSDYDRPLYGLYCSLNQYHNNNTNNCWNCEKDIKPIVEEIMKLDIPDEVRYNMKMIDKLEEVVEYSQGLDLLNHVHFTAISRKSIEDFLSLKDKTPDDRQVKLTLTPNNKNNELLSSKSNS